MRNKKIIKNHWCVHLFKPFQIQMYSWVVATLRRSTLKSILIGVTNAFTCLQSVRCMRFWYEIFFQLLQTVIICVKSVSVSSIVPQTPDETKLGKWKYIYKVINWIDWKLAQRHPQITICIHRCNQHCGFSLVCFVLMISTQTRWNWLLMMRKYFLLSSQPVAVSLW